MNYAELQQAVLDDTHKSQYAGATIQRMITQAEGLISSRLKSYNFIATLVDANRVAVNSPIYTLPDKLVDLRYVKINKLPLDKVDETTIYLRKSFNQPSCYVQRAKQIEIAGNPALLTTIDIDYMGLPNALAVTPTNTLLDEFPQLYIDATSYFVYRRAQDTENAQIAFDSVVDLCRELNRKMKKLLGGAQSAPAYNVKFRSSY